MLYMDGFDNKPAARRYVKDFCSATFDPDDSKKYKMELIYLQFF